MAVGYDSIACFIGALNRLTSKSSIPEYTERAKRFKSSDISEIVARIEVRLEQAFGETQYTILRLLDSLCRDADVGTLYRQMVSQNIVNMFRNVFEKADQKTRLLLFTLRKTWNEWFDDKTLTELDKRVNSVDPKWPIMGKWTSNRSPTSTTVRSSPKFHTSGTSPTSTTVANATPTPVIQSAPVADGQTMQRVLNAQTAKSAERVNQTNGLNANNAQISDQRRPSDPRLRDNNSKVVPEPRIDPRINANRKRNLSPKERPNPNPSTSKHSNTKRSRSRSPHERRSRSRSRWDSNSSGDSPLDDNNNRRHRSHENYSDLKRDYNSLRKRYEHMKQENEDLRTDNRELSQENSKKMAELREQNRVMSEQLAKSRTESQNLCQNMEEYMKQMHCYKLNKHNEFQALRKDLNKEKEEKQRLEQQMKKTSDENKRLNQKHNEYISGLRENQSTIVGLRKENGELRTKTQTLTVRLSQKSNQSQELVDLRQQLADKELEFEDVSNRLEMQIKDNLETKKNFNTQVIALKKQRQYFNSRNETNKRKLLATQHLYVRTEKMYRQNAHKIHDSVEKNTNENFDKFQEKVLKLLQKTREDLNRDNVKDTAEVVRDNLRETEEIYSSARKIVENPNSDFVKCPDCDRNFMGVDGLKAHQRLKHLKSYDSSFKGPVYVIDDIDISDD